MISKNKKLKRCCHCGSSA